MSRAFRLASLAQRPGQRRSPREERSDESNRGRGRNAMQRCAAYRRRRSRQRLPLTHDTSKETDMTIVEEGVSSVYAAPGQRGALAEYRSRYGHYIGGEWVEARQGRCTSRHLAGQRQALRRGRARHGGGHRGGPRRRAQGGPGLGRGEHHRARRGAEQDRRRHRREPRAARGRRVVGQRQGGARDARGRPAPRDRPLPVLRSRDPRPGGRSHGNSTTTRSPTTSTSRSASSVRSSRGTSRSSWRRGRSRRRSRRAAASC